MSKSRVCAVACLFSLFGQAASQPTVEWEKGYSGGRVFIGKVDEEGNLYSTGFTNDAYWTRDVLILKTAQDGRVLWYHTIAGNGRLELGVDVEPDGRGNVYALARQTSPGGNATNFLTMKFSRTGQLLWSQSYSEGSATPSDLAVDAQGNCYVTGYTGAPRKAVTVKYSPSGVLQWAQRFSPGTPEASVTWDVRIDPAGNVVAAGSRETGQNAREYLVIKYGSSGSQIWVRTYVGAAGWHELWDTALDTAGNIYVTGVSAGQGTGEDCATLSLSPQGNQRWVRRFTGVGTENDNGRAIAVDSSGSVYVLGYKAAGSSSAPVVLKYNAASGEQVWSKSFGPQTGTASPLALALGRTGDIHAVGTYFDELDGSPASVLARISPDGSTVWNREYVDRAVSNSATWFALDQFDNIFLMGFEFRYGITKFNQLGVLSGFSAPTEIVGGDDVFGSVTIARAVDDPAPVSLASNSTAIRLPNPVTIPAGQSTASFQISTSVVTTSSTRSLTATYNGVTRRIDVTLRPGGLQSFTANPTNLTAGASSTGTVTLSGPSRSGGTRVALVANSNVINVPSELVIPAGQTSGTFTIRTSYVSSRVTRTVTATLGSVARNVNLTIAPAFDLVVNPTSVVGGSNTTGRVTIPSAAPSGGAVIAVSTNSSALVVPTSVTVPEGQYNALFTIGTRPVSATTGRYVTITYGGVNKSALVTIEPGSSLSNLTVNPSSVRGGQNTTGTVHLAGPAPAGGTTVTLSSNSSAIVVPPSVTIPAGVTSASFTIQTKPVGSTATRTVSAARDGVTRTATVTLTP